MINIDDFAHNSILRSGGITGAHQLRVGASHWGQLGKPIANVWIQDERIPRWKSRYAGSIAHGSVRLDLTVTVVPRGACFHDADMSWW